MKLRTVAVGLVTLAVLALLASGPGTRAGFWSFRGGFALLKWTVYFGAAGAAVALIALVITRPPARRAPLVVAALIGAAAAYLPIRWRAAAGRVPAIHDITTDTEHPPEFVAILPLRAHAANPATYGGAEVAAAQRKAYPDIRPLHLSEPRVAAFARALAAARAEGWALVAADSAAGRIEATATTKWFGFRDDLVVRVTPDGDGSRVDVRSVSRVGQSDVGTNARRIREYLGRLTT